MGPTHVLVQSISFGSLYLYVFLRRDLIWFCSGEDSVKSDGEISDGDNVMSDYGVKSDIFVL